MKRKLVVGVSLVALAIAIIGSGVLYAYFSDTQTTGDNTFTTGTLLLQVGGTHDAVTPVTVSAMKPGDSSVSGWQVQNIGDMSGKLTIAVGTVDNYENTRYSVEANDGDTTGGTGATDGELGAALNVALWMDVDNDGWDAGDYYLKSDGTKVLYASDTTFGGAFASLDSYTGRTFTDIQTGIAPGSIGYFKVSYNLPTSTGNRVQSDSSAFDLTFTLNQI